MPPPLRSPRPPLDACPPPPPPPPLRVEITAKNMVTAGGLALPALGHRAAPPPAPGCPPPAPAPPAAPRRDHGEDDGHGGGRRRRVVGPRAARPRRPRPRARVVPRRHAEPGGGVAGAARDEARARDRRGVRRAA